MEPSVVEVFERAVARDGSRPFLVLYDDGPSARIELSLATLENWVAKTANFLRDGLGLETGDRVGVRLTTHWLGPVWLLAGWSAGAVIDLDALAGAATATEAGRELDVAVIGDDSPVLHGGSGSTAAAARDVVVCALRPFGGPLGSATPAGLIDFGAEVPGYGDHFQAYDRPGADAPALVAGGRTWTGAQLVAAGRARAAELATTRGLGTAEGARLMTRENPAGTGGWLDALVVPLVTNGSVVLLRGPSGEPESAVLAGRSSAEKVTLDLT